MFAPYLRLFKRHPVVMHLVELAALGVLLYAAWRIGGSGLLIAELVILGSGVLLLPIVIDVSVWFVQRGAR